MSFRATGNFRAEGMALAQAVISICVQQVPKRMSAWEVKIYAVKALQTVPDEQRQLEWFKVTHDIADILRQASKQLPHQKKPDVYAL